MIYNPTPRQILCHNLIESHDGSSIRLEILGADELTRQFGVFVLTDLANYLGIVLSPTPESISTLDNDLDELISAARDYAYSRMPSRNLPPPYTNYPLDILLRLIARSPYTFWHFVRTAETIGKSAAPALDSLRSVLISYFNSRYATSLFAIEQFPLTPGENPVFINKDEYYLRLDQEGTDIAM